MTNNCTFGENDVTLIEKIIDKRRGPGFESVHSDELLLEIQTLREKYKFSFNEIAIFIEEKHGLQLSKSYLFAVPKILKNRAKKQDISRPISSDEAQYPIYIKRPTKTPKKDVLVSEDLGTLKGSNTLHPINEVDGQKGVPKSFEDLPEIDDISVSSMVDEFLAEDEVEVLGDESLIAAKEDKNEENITTENSDFEVDTILEQRAVPKNKQSQKVENIANSKNDNQNKNDKKNQSREDSPSVEPEPKKKEPVLSDDDSLVCDIIGRPSNDESRLSAERNRSLERYERKKFLIKKKRSEEGITDDEKHELWDLTVVRYDYAPEPIDVEPI